jgi:hypothetical protein
MFSHSVLKDRLAMEKLILPEPGDILQQLSK